MAGFGSIFKKILGVGKALAPIAAAFVPGAAPIAGILDNIFGRLQTAIVTVEQNNPLSGQGQIKEQAVIADFEAGLEVTRAILAARGEALEYDHDLLKETIAHQVAAYNGMAKVKASFRIVKAAEQPEAQA